MASLPGAPAGVSVAGAPVAGAPEEGYCPGCPDLTRMKVFLPFDGTVKQADRMEGRVWLELTKAVGGLTLDDNLIVKPGLYAIPKECIKSVQQAIESTGHKWNLWKWTFGNRQEATIPDFKNIGGFVEKPYRPGCPDRGTLTFIPYLGTPKEAYRLMGRCVFTVIDHADRPYLGVPPGEYLVPAESLEEIERIYGRAGYSGE